MAADGILDYVIGVNTGRAEGDALSAIRARAAESRHADEVARIESRKSIDVAMVTVIANTWRARYLREQAARRGWQRHGMAANELIQKLTGTDEDGADDLITESSRLHKAKLDASIASVDNTLFHGEAQK